MTTQTKLLLSKLGSGLKEVIYALFDITWVIFLAAMVCTSLKKGNNFEIGLILLILYCVRAWHESEKR